MLMLNNLPHTAASDRLEATAPGEAGTMPGLLELLRAVQEFTTASAELVAWEFCLEPSDVSPIWREALERELLSFVTVDEYNEQHCALTSKGALMLSEMSTPASHAPSPLQTHDQRQPAVVG